MKKILPFLIAFCFIGNTISFAQEADEKKDVLEKFSLTPQVGLLHSWSDFKDDGLGGLFKNNELGFNLLLNYKLNKIISISAGGLFGKLNGSTDKINTTGATNSNGRDFGYGIQYNTNIFEFTLPRVDINLTRLIFKDNSELFNKLSIGLIGSHGLIYSDSEISPLQNESVNLIYRNEASPSDKRGSSGEMTEAVTSYGMSASYMLNDRLNIGIESTIRNVWNDRLDGWESNGSANDKYSFTAIGVTYHLKKRGEKIKELEIEEVKELAEEVQPEIVDRTPNEDTISDNSEPKEPKFSEIISGVFNYDKIPVKNKAIVVLDENGDAIDTVYTDERGRFEYARLNPDQVVTFAAIDEDSLDASKIKLFAEGEDGTVYQDKKNTFQEPVVDKKKPAEVKEGKGYYLAVAAFRGDRAFKAAEELKSEGVEAYVIRNKRDTWNLVVIDSFDTFNEALRELVEFRKNGYPDSWVHIK